MKVHHTLICLFLSLQDGNTGLTDAQRRYKGTEGGNITVTCLFSFHGDTKYFCRNKCEGDDKLIETEEDHSQRDRYRIEYDRRGWTEKAVLYVSITHLNKSDSGWYRCGLDGSFSFLDQYKDFELRVTAAPTPPGPNLTPAPPGPNLTPTPPGPNLTPTPLSTSLSPAAPPQSVGSSAPSSPAGSGYFLVVAVCVSVLVAVVLLAVVVLLLLYIQKMKDCCGSEWRGNMDHTNMECISNEYVSPPSTCEDSIYQGLDPASRNQDQTYSTLTHICSQ